MVSLGGIARKLFGSSNDRRVKSFQPKVAAINALEPEMQKLSDALNGKDTILESALSFVRYDEPIDWGGEEVRFVVGIAGKENGHLEILTKIAIVFSEEDDVAKLVAASTPEEVLDLLGDIND